MQIKIRGYETKEIELRVDDYKILEEAIKIVLKDVGLHEDHFLRDGEVRYDDPDHRHGSIQELVLRKATPEDLLAFGVVSQLRALRQKLMQVKQN